MYKHTKMENLVIFFVIKPDDEKRVEHTRYASHLFVDGFLAGVELLELSGVATDLARDKYKCHCKLGEFEEDLSDLFQLSRCLLMFVKFGRAHVYQVPSKVHGDIFMDGMRFLEHMANRKVPFPYFYVDSNR